MYLCMCVLLAFVRHAMSLHVNCVCVCVSPPLFLSTNVHRASTILQEARHRSSIGEEDGGMVSGARSSVRIHCDRERQRSLRKSLHEETRLPQVPDADHPCATHLCQAQAAQPKSEDSRSETT